MIVGTAWFAQREIHKQAWVFSDGTTSSRIDIVLIDGYLSPLRNIRMHICIWLVFTPWWGMTRHLHLTDSLKCASTPPKTSQDACISPLLFYAQWSWDDSFASQLERVSSTVLQWNCFRWMCGLSTPTFAFQLHRVRVTGLCPRQVPCMINIRPALSDDGSQVILDEGMELLSSCGGHFPCVITYINTERTLA